MNRIWFNVGWNGAQDTEIFFKKQTSNRLLSSVWPSFNSQHKWQKLKIGLSWCQRYFYMIADEGFSESFNKCWQNIQMNFSFSNTVFYNDTDFYTIHKSVSQLLYSISVFSKYKIGLLFANPFFRTRQNMIKIMFWEGVSVIEVISIHNIM